MRHVVHVAPLASLPAHASVFDYAWESDEAPSIGTVITIPFRSRDTFGIILGVSSTSPFKLKTIQTESSASYKLLTTQEVSWFESLAKKLRCSIGALIQHCLPPLGKRTIQTLHTRTNNASATANAGKLQYVWYSQQNSVDKILEEITKKELRPHILVVSTHEEALRLSILLRSLQSRPVHHLTAESAPERRAIWQALVSSTEPPIIVGTHLAVWLPTRAKTHVLLIEPTHESHIQWDGIIYSNRHVIEERRLRLAEDVTIIAHSPASEDLDRITSIPTLPQWPIIVDRTTEDPQLRQKLVSPSLELNFKNAKSILIFVSHLREATHYICKDCGALYRSEDIKEKTGCVKCNGTQFSKIGCGAQSVAHELESVGYANNSDEILLLDAIGHRKNVGGLNTKKFTVATTPLYDRIDLGSYDLIVDLSADFELLHPEFNTEELLFDRLRGCSVRLPSGWTGLWYVQTRKPHILAWRVRDIAGYTAWWNGEKILRKRFKQPPFIED